MTKRQTYRAALAAGLLLAGVLVGCDAGRYMTYLFTDPQKETVRASFPGLEDSSVAVLIYVEEAILYDYPNVRLSLGSQLAATLEEHVPGIRVVSPVAIARYQDDNVHWDTADRTRIARDLKVDYVLLVSMLEYTLRQPGQMNAYQGRIIGEARVFDASKPEERADVWSIDEPLEVVYPDVARYSPSYLQNIRQVSENRFADKLTRQFHTHTITVDPDAREK